VDHTGAIALTRAGGDLEDSIRVVLLTAPGERLMRPQFGCRIWDLMFEPVNANLLGLISEAVRDALGQGGRIRIDVNGAWSVSEAQRHIKELDRFDLEYVEQPVATLEEMSDLRTRVDVPIAADESIRTAEDPVRAARAGAADIIILKVQPLGGVKRCLEVADDAGLPCVVSSALETSIGIAAGLALAAALPELPYACGLGTVALLERDVVADPLLPVRGVLVVRRPEIDEAALARVETDPAPWIRRLEEADAWAR
jgi:O-succinylbenzoate synthase